MATLIQILSVISLGKFKRYTTKHMVKNTWTLTVTNLVVVLPCCMSITIKPRSSWGAAPARSPSRINGAVDYVIIHHSDNPNGCNTESACQRLIKNIQTDHKGRRNFSDIGYNFIIGGDGNIYEGRGWGLQGSHAPKYNRNSIGIVFLGNFESKFLLYFPSKQSQSQIIEIF